MMSVQPSVKGEGTGKRSSQARIALEQMKPSDKAGLAEKLKEQEEEEKQWAASAEFDEITRIK